MKRIQIVHIALALTLGISSSVAISQSPDRLQAAKRIKTSRHESEGVERLGNLPYQEEYSSPYIQFISEREGWVAIGRKLFRTQDAGRKWECIFDRGDDKSGYINFISGFQFINSEVGWIRMFDEMLKTEDGGRTWNPLPQPIRSILTKSRIKGWFRAFRFLEDGKRGWVGGGVYRPLGEEEWGANRFMGNFEDGKKQGLIAAVFYTDDGGKSWKEHSITRAIGDINGFYFLDAEHAWVTGQAGIFYLEDGEWKVTDSGLFGEEPSQHKINSLEITIGAPTFCPIEVFFLDSRSGWMSNSNGYVSHSTDGGKTWADLTDPDTVWTREPTSRYPFFYQFFFINLSDGWGLDSNGDLYKTSDGGLTWTKTISGLDLEHIQFLNHHLALAVSKEGLYRIDL